MALQFNPFQSNLDIVNPKGYTGGNLDVTGNLKIIGSVTNSIGGYVGDYSFAANQGTASGIGSTAIGLATSAIGTGSFASGFESEANSSWSIVGGYRAVSNHSNSWVWRGGNPDGGYAFSTKAYQFLVSAQNGIALYSKVGIGTDSDTNALTVVGTVSTSEHGSSDLWNLAYTTVKSESASWTDSTDTGVRAITADFVNKEFIQTNYLNNSGGEISGDLTVQGSLFVTGTGGYIDFVDFKVTDPTLYLGINNPADSLDLGIIGVYNTLVYDDHKHTGLIRNHLDKKWVLFSNLTACPLSSINVALDDPSLVIDTLKANLEGNIDKQNITIRGSISGQNNTVSFNRGRAIGDSSFAINDNNISLNFGTFARGHGNISSGGYSVSEGVNTVVGERVPYEYNSETKEFTFTGLVSSKFVGEFGAGAIIGGYSPSHPGYVFTITMAGPANNVTGAISALDVPENLGSTGELVRPSGYGAHAEGYRTQAIGQYSHAEGYETKSIGEYSRSAGFISIAGGFASQAQGVYANALGNASHAYGQNVYAIGGYSVATGFGAVAAHANTFIWGGALTFMPTASTTRSNQFMVGNATGGIYLSGSVGINTDSIQRALTVVGDISASGNIFGGNITSQNVSTATSVVSVFTSSSTWSKPLSAKFVCVNIVGGGGGGGSGRYDNPSTTRGGGGGGGGGGFTQLIINAQDLPNTVTVTVGAGGTGGAPQVVIGSNGNNGNNGGESSFGIYGKCTGGTGGVGGTTTATTAAAAGTAMFNAGVGGVGVVGTSVNGPGGNAVAAGGGGGAAGCSAGNASSNGYIGGVTTLVDLLAGVGGVTGTENGGSGESNIVGVGLPGPGGGGGRGQNLSNGGNGGNGGLYGGGGGGGAGSAGSQSGGGGGGANGIVVVKTIF